MVVEVAPLSSLEKEQFLQRLPSHFSFWWVRCSRRGGQVDNSFYLSFYPGPFFILMHTFAFLVFRPNPRPIHYLTNWNKVCYFYSIFREFLNREFLIKTWWLQLRSDIKPLLAILHRRSFWRFQSVKNVEPFFKACQDDDELFQFNARRWAKCSGETNTDPTLCTTGIQVSMFSGTLFYCLVNDAIMLMPEL